MGFNALGDYDPSSGTAQLFAPGGPSTTWTDPVSKTTYRVPPNMHAVADSLNSPYFFVFDGQEQFSQQFAIDAELKGGGRYFAGEFDVAYSSLKLHDAANYFAMAQQRVVVWGIQLESTSIDVLSPSFTDSPVVEVLPLNFSPDNQQAFYDLFDMFGTHFVSYVRAGGRLDYFIAVSQDSTLSEDRVKADATFEFKGYFASDPQKAAADWSKVDGSWLASREGRMQAQGGDESIIGNLQFPTQSGANVPTALGAWTASVRSNPAIAFFKLRPLSALFSGPQATAIGQALRSYANTGLSVEAELDRAPAKNGAHIVAAGTPVPQPSLPAPPPGVAVSFWWLVLTDNDGRVLFNQVKMGFLDSLVEAAAPIVAKNPGCWMAAAGVGMRGSNYPSQKCLSFLHAFGASLDQWRQDQGNSSGPGVAYACVGRQGSTKGTATESYLMTNDMAVVSEKVEASALYYPRPEAGRARLEEWLARA
ncbi:MAG TPA: MAC/perforin domain-containing protein [Solirubrobacteraceae bacterium]|nr:MAC/perforin domain-containing protein [Solirubrobacteraceae bacterium]